MTATSDNDFVPGPVLLLGAPGVGKGTQAQVLMAAWGVPQVSTGDLIRDNIHNQTQVGLSFKELVAAGTLVPDEIVNHMVGDRLARPDAQQGYILDGYPRTLAQAEWLDNFLARNAIEGRASMLPVIAVSIEVRYDELLRRITGRRTGSVSKRIYNIYSNPPVRLDFCDVDGAPLVQRSDDTVEVFAERMRAFEHLTAPVIDHYRQLSRFEVVDGEQPVERVTHNIATALKRLRQGAK